ncbi:MAG: hypothetical protein U0325_20815 [Polyangiales bacterium]
MTPRVAAALGLASLSGCAWGYRGGLDALGATRGQAQVQGGASLYGGFGSTSRFDPRPRSSGIVLVGTLTAGVDAPAGTPTLHARGGLMGFSVPEHPDAGPGYQITVEGGPGGRDVGLRQAEVIYTLRGGPLVRLRAHTRPHGAPLFLLGVDLVGNVTIALDGTSEVQAAAGLAVSLHWLHVAPFHL